MEAPRRRTETPTGPGWLTAGVVQSVLIVLLSVAAARPPAPRPADADPALFSAGRALETLARLDDGRPHPVGSAANDALRGRLLTELAALGLEPETQRRMVCSPEGACAEVENVLARLPPGATDAPGPTDATDATDVTDVTDVADVTGPGAESDPARTGEPGATGEGSAVLLVAHYDSVAAGPGVGDDLSGVACLLEVARALSVDAVGARRRPVLLLFTDGEEAGLLGARAFAEHHPWMAEVGVVINLEARGTSGGSILFETGPDNAWVVGQYARAAPHPTATSYSVEIYRRMPNDTDFTPFREAGLPGVNFAFIEDVHDYHTRNDTLERLDPASVQGHGENVLPLVRALAASDIAALAREAPGDLVYSDILSRFMLTWPASWGLPILLLEVALFALCLARAGGLTRAGGAALLGLARALGGWLLAALAGTGLAAVLALGDGPVGALHPMPVWIVYASAACIALAAPLSPGAGSAGCLGLAAAWLAGAALTTSVAPGASHLFTLPLAPLLVGLLVVGPARAVERTAGRLLLLAVCALHTLLWAPLLHGLANAFGLGAGGPLVAVAVASAPWLAPLAAASAPAVRRRVSFAALALLLPTLAVAAALPRASSEVPAHATFHHVVDTDTGEGLVVADAPRSGLPATLRPEFDREPPGYLGDLFGTVASAAEPIALPPAELEVVEEGEVEESGDRGRRRVVAILRSPGRAECTWIAFGALAEVRIRTGAGVSAADEEPPRVVGSPLAIARVPEEGLELEILLPAGRDVPVALVDQRFGASPRVAELRARCGAARVPRRQGDSVLVASRFALEAPGR